MTGEIYVDVSKYQVYLDETYTRKFFMFRLVNEYGNVDSKAAGNLAMALKMRSEGKLVNFGGYVNPGEGVSNASIQISVNNLGFPRDAVLMLDAEPWPDANGVPLNKGNHSTQFNSLASAFVIRQNNRQDLVWGYSYKYAMVDLWPSRPSWLGFVAASYSSTQPTWVSPMAAWQYTDGPINSSGLPNRSSPFGVCDHNKMLIPIPIPTINPTESPDMDATQAQQLTDVHTWLQRLSFGFDNLSETPFSSRAELTNRIRSIDTTDGQVLAQAKANGVGISGLATSTAVAFAEVATGAQVAAVLNAVAQLDTSGIIDYTKVQAAAEAGAAAALARTSLAVG